MSNRSDVLWSGTGDVCEVEIVHAAAVERVRRRQASEDEVERLSAIFQALSAPARLRILEALAEAELCVCDLAQVVGTTQSAVSHHLRHLRDLRLVRFRKAGRMAFYRLDDEHVDELLRIGLAHVRE